MYTDAQIEYYADYHVAHDLYRTYGIRFDTFMCDPQSIIEQQENLRPIPVAWPPGNRFRPPQAEITTPRRAWPLIASLIIVALMVITTSVANASGWNRPDTVRLASDWSRADTVRQTSYLTLHAIDWGQTRNIAARCETTKLHETNPLLGKCPGMGEVNVYFVGTAIAHTLTAMILPRKIRERMQLGTMVMQLGYTTNNVRLGLQVQF